MRKIRLALAIILILASLSLLAWGLWPAARERRILSISPTEMTLPTPASFMPREPNVPQDGFTYAAAEPEAAVRSPAAAQAL